jgi:hypothetical protein
MIVKNSYIFSRFDCYPKDGVDQSKCEARGCCWNPPADVEDELRIATPFCYYPTGYQSYILSNSTKFKSGKTLFYKRILESGYPGDVDVIRVDVSFHEKERIRVKVIIIHWSALCSPLDQVLLTH